MGRRQDDPAGDAPLQPDSDPEESRHRKGPQRPKRALAQDRIPRVFVESTRTVELQFAEGRRQRRQDNRRQSQDGQADWAGEPGLYST